MEVDDRRELTLLERREETEARLVRCEALFRPPPPTVFPRPAERPLIVPRPFGRCDTGLEPALLIDDVCVSAWSVTGSSFRFPFGSSLNHRWNVDSKLARLRCPEPTLLPRVGICGSDVSVSAGEPVSGGGDCFPARIHGEPTWPWPALRSVGGGVDDNAESLTARIGGVLMSLPEPLPCDERGSSLLATLFAACFSFSSRSRRSRSSRTASADFLRTRPAASSAVVARCIMLTLPARFLRPFEP